MHIPGLLEIPMHLFWLCGRAGQEGLDDVPRARVSDDSTLHKSKGSRRNGESVVHIDRPIAVQITLPTVRLQPVADVIDFLEVLVPVDDQPVVIPDSPAGLLSASAASDSVDVFDVLPLAVTADDVSFLIDVSE